MSTAASRAWLGVALLGLIVVVLVLALMLVPRFGAGQEVLDAAGPAFTDERVAGTRAGVNVVSQYVDVVDPLLTQRGGGEDEFAKLVGFIRRTLGLSTDQVRKILRREAPHVEALTRALPLSGVAGEVPELTEYLATTLGITEDELAATLEQDFPRISQSLTALRTTADGWYDVPGIEGLTRLSRGKPVRTVPGLRKYLRDDVVPLMVAHERDVQKLAGSGGIGYVPYLLLVIGIGMLALGVVHARRAAESAPGRRAWGVVVAAGVLVILLVGAGQFFPRLAGAQRTTEAFEPVFTEARVTGAATGLETVHEAIALGDPLMTPESGAAREAPALYRFVAGRTGRTAREVKGAVRRRAPQTTALLDALPLTAVSAEIKPLTTYLARALRQPGGELLATLRSRFPGVTRALEALPEVTAAWNEIPGTQRMTRFGGVAPVRTVPEFDDYLRQDLMPVLVSERENFDSLASRWPPLDRFPPVLLILGLVLLLYGAVMMQFVAVKRR